MSKLQNFFKTSMPFSVLAIAFLLLAFFQKNDTYLKLGVVWAVIAIVLLVKNKKI